MLLLGCFGSMFTLFWVYVGPSWDYVGTRLGFVELSWAYAGFCWVVFGPSWDYVAPPGVALGLCSLYFRFMLDHLGTMLGLWCWVLLGRLGPMLAHLGTMLGVPGFYVGPSWLRVGLSWGFLGLCCAVLGLCRTKKGHQSAKVVWNHVSKPVFHGICNVFYT